MEFIYDALVLEGLIVYFLLKGVIKKAYKLAQIYVLTLTHHPN